MAAGRRALAAVVAIGALVAGTTVGDAAGLGTIVDDD